MFKALKNMFTNTNNTPNTGYNTPNTGYFIIEKNTDTLELSIKFKSNTNTNDNITDSSNFKDICKHYKFLLKKDLYEYCYSKINSHLIGVYFYKNCDSKTGEKKLDALHRLTKNDIEYFSTGNVEYIINREELEQHREELEQQEEDKKKYEEQQQKLREKGLISGGKKNRKSRRKSKRTKKTAKRRR